MAISTSDTSFTFGKVLEVLFRRKKLAVLLPLLIIGLGLGIALFAPRSYRSEARIFLQVGRESLGINPTVQTGQQTISLQQQGRDSEVTTATEILTSRGVIGILVDELGCDYILRGGPEGTDDKKPNAILSTLTAPLGYAMTQLKSIDPISDREEAIITVEKNLGVDSERDSTILNLTYTTDTPVGAQKVLDTLLNIYQEEHLRIHRNSGSRSFFKEQGELLRTQLDEAMQQLRNAKNEMGIASIGARRNNLESQLQSVQLAVYNAETDRSASMASLEDLTLQLRDMPERMIASEKKVPNQGADLLREKLYGLQVRKMELRSRYSKTHPLVVAVSAQVEAAEEIVNQQAEFREETVHDVNPIHRELSLSIKQKESSVAGLNARLKKLDDQHELINSDLENLNGNEVRLAQLERDKSLLNSKYHQYSENLEQARIDEALDEKMMSSICIAQDPTLAMKPVSPSKALVGLGSLFLAFAGTGCLLLGMEQLDTKVRNEEAVADATELPVLATIPESSAHSHVYS